MDYLLTNHDIFKNPQYLPLNKVNIQLGKNTLVPTHEQRVTKYPALHKAFIDSHVFSFYQPYYEYAEDIEEMSENFIQGALEYIESLEFLLQLNYHQFWCYLTQDPDCAKMLKSFLYKFTSDYKLSQMNEYVLETYCTIHENVALILTRILTLEHSPTEYMEESTICKLLQQNKLLMFPVVLNLCALYANSCPELVSNFTRLFFSESRKNEWMSELDAFLKHVMHIMHVLSEQIPGHDKSTVVIPMGIPTKPRTFDPYWYDEAVTFFLDTIISLNGIIGHCPVAVHKAMALGIPGCVTHFCSHVFPSVYSIMEPEREHIANWATIQSKIYDRIASARHECVNCFQTFTTSIIDRIIQLQGKTREQEEQFEYYIEMVSAALENELFIFDYHNTVSVEQQVHLIKDFYPELDPMRSSYLLQCLSAVPVAANICEKPAPLSELISINSPPLKSHQPQVSTSTQLYSVEPSEDEIDEAIQIVLDALPDYGDAYILKCLRAYNYNPIDVIHAILEDNISPSIDMAPDAIRVPPETQSEEILFGYRGKKAEPNDARELLDDKTNLYEIKDYILNQQTTNYSLYDDDYDDRDDIEPIPSRKRTDEVDPYSYMENRFEVVKATDAGTSSSDEASANPMPQRDKVDRYKMFCEDPAKLREERENAWRNNGAGRGKSRDPKRDVVGKPKGQGQDTSVLKNRDKKTVHKSSRANHNRKAGAQWKQSRGMF